MTTFFVMKNNLITKFLGIVVLGLVISFHSQAIELSSYKSGKGPLKLSEHTANVMEYFFSGGTRGVYAEKQKLPWKPGNIAISVDGKHFSYFRHPYHVTEVDNKHYTGMAISDCQKKSNQQCYTFAVGYRIKWDNGTSKKSRKLKRKEVKAGKTIDKLIELGFYDAGIIQTKKVEKKKVEIKKKTTTEKTSQTGGSNDIVQDIKELKELYDSGVLTKEEFEKAKKKLLK